MSDALIPAMSHDLENLGSFQYCEDGLRVVGNPPPEAWIAYGEGLRRVGRSWQWNWGDFLNEMEKRFGELWMSVVEQEDYDKGTAYNYKRTCEAFPKERRRAGRVDFSHFVRLVGRPEDEQEAWLDRVEADGLSCNRLYQLLSPSDMVTLKLSRGEVERTADYVGRYDPELSGKIRGVLK